MDIRDEPNPPVLRRARRNCPLCGDLSIDTSRRPGSAEQWQGWWMSVTRRDIQPGPNQLGPPQRDGRSTALQLQSVLSERLARASYTTEQAIYVI
jgi:hypothetical protein